MPSEQRPQPQAYLYKALADGAKPFRYRSGIRTLLGQPENPDTQVSHPLPLPPAGFHYLRQASFDEPAHAPRQRPEKEDFLTEIPERHTAQGLQAPESAHGFDAPQAQQKPDTPRNTPIAPYSFKSAPGSQHLPHRESGTEGETGPIQKTMESASTQIQIDIPGFSEKVRRFSALTPRKKEDTPQTQKDAPETRTTGTAPLTQNVRTEIIDRLNVPQTAVSASRQPPQKTHPAIGKMQNVRETQKEETKTINRATTPSLHHLHKVNAGDQQALRKMETWTENTVYKNQLPSNTPRETNPHDPLPIRRTQQAAESRIEQLRQSLQTLKQKTSTRESDAEKPPETPRHETVDHHRPPDLTPQPVVIVKRAPVRRQSPAAFWERNYMSHLFRVRPLR